jgi:hypothetical protein
VTGWSRGREEILGMIERRELTQVTAGTELAERLLATARQHVASARLLADSDPYLAYAALHDAIRKALAALLQVQGLRATTSGGHLAVTQAVQAQFGTTIQILSACDGWFRRCGGWGNASPPSPTRLKPARSAG